MLGFRIPPVSVEDDFQQDKLSLCDPPTKSCIGVPALLLDQMA
jgi:hypothetical protein